MPRVIEKKIWLGYFELLKSGKKSYEFRLADFEVEEGDVLLLREWDQNKKEYTGREIKKTVTHVGHWDMNDTKFWNEDEKNKYGFHIISIK